MVTDVLFINFTVIYNTFLFRGKIVSIEGFFLLRPNFGRCSFSCMYTAEYYYKREELIITLNLRLP